MSGQSYRFCPLCGTALVERTLPLEKQSRPACPACDFVHYRNPTPAAGVIVVEKGRLLLVERKFEPRVGEWTLPAGFVEWNEDALSCAVRETKEETNLDVEPIRLFGVYSAFDDPRASVVLVLYLVARVGGELKCGDDASDARFFPLDDLPQAIAFRAHRDALRDVIRLHEAHGL